MGFPKNHASLVAGSVLALLTLQQTVTPLDSRAESLVWSRTYDGGTGSTDSGFGVAVVPDGSVYVTGRTYVSGLPSDLVLRKYSPAGALLWGKTYNGPGNEWDWGGDVAIGTDGGVYVAGVTSRFGQDANLLLRKYSPTGAVLWTRIYNGAANLGDYGDGIAIGRDGSVYVAGRTDVAGQGTDLLLRKYSSSGAVLWTRTYNGALNIGDFGSAVAIGPDGSAYVAGRMQTGGYYDYDLLLLKYSSAGSVLWTRTFNGAAKLGDFGFDVAVGPDGGVYVTGRTGTAGGAGDLLLRKYSPTGAVLWTRTYNGTANGWDEGWSVAVQRDGSVYVTGFTTVAGQDRNLLLRRYSAAGDVLWTRTYNGVANGSDSGFGVAVGADGSVCVTGSTYSATEGQNLLLQKYR